MSILNYYVDKQSDAKWVTKFQSISRDNCGKNFTFYNTNFRSILSFQSQLTAFIPSINVPRNSWKKSNKTGQEEDKQRVVNLQNGKFIEYIKDKDVFILTEKGKELVRLSSIKELQNGNKNNLWLLIYLLLLDYSNKEVELDIERTVLHVFNNLEKAGIDISSFLNLLQDTVRVSSKEDLFKKDGFWLITFNEEPDFLKLYLESNESERDSLHNYVIACSRNKDSKDLLAHKFVSSGVYSWGSFVEDIYVMLFTIVALTILTKDINHFIETIIRISNHVGKVINKDIILNAIKTIACYSKTYENSIGKIIDKKNEEDK